MILRINAQYSVGIERKEIQKIRGEFDKVMNLMKLDSNNPENYWLLEDCESARVIIKSITKDLENQIYQQIYKNMF